MVRQALSLSGLLCPQEPHHSNSSHHYPPSQGSRRRDCHFTDTPCLSLLKHLIQVQGVPSNDSLADGYRRGAAAAARVAVPAGYMLAVMLQNQDENRNVRARRNPREHLTALTFNVVSTTLFHADAAPRFADHALLITLCWSRSAGHALQVWSSVEWAAGVDNSTILELDAMHGNLRCSSAPSSLTDGLPTFLKRIFKKEFFLNTDHLTLVDSILD